MLRDEYPYHRTVVTRHPDNRAPLHERPTPQCLNSVLTLSSGTWTITRSHARPIEEPPLSSVTMPCSSYQPNNQSLQTPRSILHRHQWPSHPRTAISRWSGLTLSRTQNVVLLYPDRPALDILPRIWITTTLYENYIIPILLHLK